MDPPVIRSQGAVCLLAPYWLLWFPIGSLSSEVGVYNWPPYTQSAAFLDVPVFLNKTKKLAAAYLVGSLRTTTTSSQSDDSKINSIRGVVVYTKFRSYLYQSSSPYETAVLDLVIFGLYLLVRVQNQKSNLYSRLCSEVQIQLFGCTKYFLLQHILFLTGIFFSIDSTKRGRAAA